MNFFKLTQKDNNRPVAITEERIALIQANAAGGGTTVFLVPQVATPEKITVKETVEEILEAINAARI